MLMRVAAERGLVGGIKSWWIDRDKRNLTSHTDNAAVASDVAASLPAVARDAEALLSALRRQGAGDAGD